MAPRRRSLDPILPLIFVAFLMLLVTVHCAFIPLVAGSCHRTRIAAAGVSTATATAAATLEGGSCTPLDIRANVLAQLHLVLEVRGIGFFQPGRDKTGGSAACKANTCAILNSSGFIISDR